MNLASIIIVNYNGKHFLKDCLESIKASEASNEEIIIVDNASTDGSRDFLRREFPSVKLVELDRNYGFAEANNRGANAASGRLLVFLNNDTVVTSGWFKSLVETLSSDPATGAVGSKLLLYDQRGKVNSAGASIVFTGGGYDVGFMDIDSGKYNIPGPRGAVCAASMMVRKDEFLALGGFDPLYFMYFEDIDLCWRYWLFGYKVMYEPNSVVYHKFGGTSGKSRHTPLRVFYGTRNSIFNILKNDELHNVCAPFFFNVLHHTGKFAFFMATLRLKSALAIVRAYASLARHLPQVLRKRKDIQEKRKVADRYLFKNSLIVSFTSAVREFVRLKKA